jgi:small subunit ribosomal protein S21
MNFRKSDTQKHTPPIRVKGISVEVRDNNLNKALRIFNKKVQDDGRLRLVKESSHYEKPTAKRKRESQLARKRWLKKKANTNLSI